MLSSQKKKIYNYFYFLRIISSFSVVLIHVTDQYYYLAKINSYNFKISFFYSGISRFGVPVFFMISGALFLSRDISFKTMYLKYIKNIFIRLIFWSFIYSISNTQLSKKNIKKIFFAFIGSHYHLWFLFSIIGLYMLVPFLREITKKNELIKMFILLSLIFSFIIPSFIIFLSYYSNEISLRLKYIYIWLNLNYISGNIFYFMLGYYINNINDMIIVQKIFIYIVGLFGVYFTIGLSYKIALKNKKNRFFSPRHLNIAAYSAMIFLFIKNLFNNDKFHTKYNFSKIISKNTFGIYLIHPLILENKELKIFEKALSIKLIFRIPLITFLTYLSSLFISIIIKYIPLIGNYLI